MQNMHTLCSEVLNKFKYGGRGVIFWFYMVQRDPAPMRQHFSYLGAKKIGAPKFESILCHHWIGICRMPRCRNRRPPQICKTFANEFNSGWVVGLTGRCACGQCCFCKQPLRLWDFKPRSQKVAQAKATILRKTWCAVFAEVDGHRAMFACLPRRWRPVEHDHAASDCAFFLVIV